MSFSTKSYLAGVGTVVAALTIGFSGGFFLAAPTLHVEQNRLQRVSGGAPVANSTAQAAIATKPDTTEVRPIEMVASPIPATSMRQPAPAETIPVMATTAEPASVAVAPKTAEPNRTTSEDNAAKPDAKDERTRNAETKAAERMKRARDLRTAELRKQREIAMATVAVKRMLREREPQLVADRTESPRFGFFGEN